MERLILFRHGKAEAESASGDDFDRRLAPRGVSDSAAMGAHLAEMGFRPHLVLVSTAARARETWEAASPAFPAAQVSLLPELYNADMAAIRNSAEAAGLGKSTVMVVGHNPGLQELTLTLLIEGGAPSGLISRATRGFPPAATSVFLIDDNGRPHFDGLFFPEP